MTYQDLCAPSPLAGTPVFSTSHSDKSKQFLRNLYAAAVLKGQIKLLDMELCFCLICLAASANRPWRDRPLDSGLWDA